MRRFGTERSVWWVPTALSWASCPPERLWRRPWSKISPTAVPPVCKLMDYGKFKFEQQKREKEARKNQRVVEIKEVRMSPGIDVNDFNVKVRNAQKFLADGDRVKVTVRFRGREMAHTEIGKDLLLKFAEQCAEVATLDKDPKLDGRHMSIFLSSKVGKDAKK